VNVASITRRRAGLAGRLGDLSKMALSFRLPQPYVSPLSPERDSGAAGACRRPSLSWRGHGAGIRAADLVLLSTRRSHGSGDHPKMSDPPATIAKRPRPPVSRAPREQRRSG